MNRAVTILELKGFAALSTALARDMEAIAVTPERVRAGVIQIIATIADRCRDLVPVIRHGHIGGDTWFFESQDLSTAITFGILLMRTIESKATQGFYFLKPSLASTVAEPKLLENRFLDDESIAAYRAADGGKPFRYLVVGEATERIKLLPWVKVEAAVGETATATAINWRDSSPTESQLPATDVALPTLLLDSEIIYSRSAPEALLAIQQQQGAARSIQAFGGPAPLNVPMYRSYIKTTIALIRESNGPEFNVLSYIPENEPETSYAWLELCRRLSIQYHPNYSFRAFVIPQGQLRPFSFQVFDEDTVHLGLRAYSPQKGTPTMSAAIMFRNRQIASRFRGEFIENWRALDGFGDASYAAIQQRLQGLSSGAKKAALADVDALLKDA